MVIKVCQAKGQPFASEKTLQLDLTEGIYLRIKSLFFYLNDVMNRPTVGGAKIHASC